ncbi:MAG TPA: DoxX family membrane protein [Gaiellaceae bacterium]|nr:DoxX family membrane protein [Gaiellaceae bacterium]
MTGLGKLVLRATVGGYFVGHGMQKLAGWFGGGGPQGTGEHFEQIGLRPGRESALLAGAAEAGGGSLLALGLFTPAAVSMLSGVMTNAIRHVHAQNGLWVTNGGIEYPAVILAALAALADGGPGRYSLDEALGMRLRGPLVTALAMGAGAAGAVYVAEHGPELFSVRPGDEDEALSRSAERSAATI